MPVISANPRIPAPPQTHAILPPFPSMAFVETNGYLTHPALQFLQQLYAATLGIVSGSDLSLAFDNQFGGEQGSIIYRGKDEWEALPPSEADNWVLISNGPDENPEWVNPSTLSVKTGVGLEIAPTSTVFDATLSFEPATIQLIVPVDIVHGGTSATASPAARLNLGAAGITISETPPIASGINIGDGWWETTTGQLYIWYYDGTSFQWVAASNQPGAVGPPGPPSTIPGPPGPPGRFAIGPTPPISPYAGDGWWDSDTGQLYLWYNDGSTEQWVAASNQPGPPGPEGAAGPTGPPGTGVAGFTGGSIPFADPSGLLIEDNPNLFFDDVTNKLILGTPLDITSGGTGATLASSALFNLGGAPLVDPVFTGNPRAPTPLAGDNDTSIATTAFVVAGDNFLQGQIDSIATGGGIGTITGVTAGTGLTGGGTSGGVTLSLIVPVSISLGGTGATTPSVALANIGGAPLASPIFTGDPQAPTSAPGDNDTSIATTAFVTAAITTAPNKTITLTGDASGSGTSSIPLTLATVNSNIGTFQGITVNAKGLVTAAVNQSYAPLASPVFTGNPTAPTSAPGDNDTSIATTAFVQAAIIASPDVTISNTPPISPVVGDMWWDSVSGDLFVRYNDGTSAQWVPATNNPGPTGLTGPIGPAGPTGSAGAPGSNWLVGDGLTLNTATTPDTISLTIPVPITSGGTGAITAPVALTNLGAAPIVSPAFTGNPTAPTSAPGDNDTSIATTAFVTSALTTATGSFTSGSVLFADTTGAITQNNAKLFWDNTGGNLRIGSATALGVLTAENAGTAVYSQNNLAGGIRATVSNSDITTGNFSRVALSSYDTGGTQRYGAGITAVFTARAATTVTADFTVQTVNLGTTAERLRILGSGFVGIGNFSVNAPQALLHVGTSSAATARSYNTFTDASNGEWAYMGDWASNVVRYGTSMNGTGVARAVDIHFGGVSTLFIGSIGVQVSSARFQLTGTATTTISSLISTGATLASSVTSSQYGLAINPTISPTGASLSTAYGVANLTVLTGAVNINDFIGYYMGGSIAAGYTGTSLVNVTSYMSFPPGNSSAGANPSIFRAFWSRGVGYGGTTGTFTNAHFVADAFTIASTGATINSYGAFLTLPSGGATAGTNNNYALYLTGAGGTAAGGTVNNFALYSASSQVSYMVGPLLIGGANTALTVSGASNQGLQLASTGGTARFTLVRASNDTNSPAIFFGKGRGNLLTAVAVQANDPLMDMRWAADDGSTAGSYTVISATHRVEVDGTVSTGIVPGRFVWLTQGTAGGAVVERLRITANGLLTFGGATSSFPALKRSTTELQVRLADDSNYTSIAAVTATPGTSTNQLATTAFVQAAIGSSGGGTITGVTAGTGLTGGGITGGVTLGLIVPVTVALGGTGAITAAGALTSSGAAPIASPTFTGVPAAPTAAPGTSTTQLATTAFVISQITSSSGTITGVTAGTGLTGGGTFGSVTLSLVVPVTVALGGTGATTAVGALTNLGAAPIASPTFTGDPQAPTPLAGDNDTSIATTAFVATSFAPLASPTFTGVPAGPTATPLTSTTQLATTAFVTTAVAAAGTITNVTAGTGLTGGGSTGIVTVSLIVPVAVTSGGTGATTAPAALTSLGAAPIAGATFTGKVITVLSATGGAGFNLPHGAAPTAPVNGDLWTTTTGIFVRINTVTVGPLLSGNQTITLSGDISGSGTTAITTILPNVNANVGTFQGLTVNAKGLVTAAVNQNYAPLASPTFTGIPAAPTATAGTNTTQLATTAFVSAAITAAPNKTITLTGDVTGSGTASFATTLATVNANIGTFQGITVNAKGLVTAAVNQSYLTANQNITISGDASGSGTSAISLTLATVNANIGTFQGITVNAKGLVTAAVNQSYLTANQTITLTGAVTGSGTTSIATTLATVPVSSGGTGATTGPVALVNLGAAPINSPTFTGIPAAITAAPGTSTTQLATTAFVSSAIVASGGGTITGVTAGTGLTGGGTTGIVTVSLIVPVAVTSGGTGAITAPAALTSLGAAPITSPIFLGDPRAPTPATADNDTSIATTAYVKAQGYADITPSTTPPTSPLVGDGWWDSNSGQLFIWYNDGTSSQWVPATNKPGPIGLTGPIGPVGPAGPTGPAGGGTITGVTAGTGLTGGGTTGSVTLSLSIPVPITSGGTGAITAPAALTSLGAAPLASPTFTGIPAAPTATAGTNTTQLATTAFVSTEIIAAPNKTITLTGDVTGSGTASFATTLAAVNANVGTFQGLTVNAKGLVTAAVNQGYATLADPIFTGDPRAPTPLLSDNDTSIATTAFVKSVIASAGQIFYLDPTDAADVATYKRLLLTPSSHAETNIPVVCTGTSDFLVASFITDPGVPGAVEYPAGSAYRRLYGSVSAGVGRFHLQIYSRTAGGVETLVRDEFSNSFANTTATLQEWLSTPASVGVLLVADRIVTKIYAQRVSGSASITVTFYAEGSAHASQIQTTLSPSASAPISATPPLALSGGNLTIDLSAYLPLTGGTISGNLTVVGTSALGTTNFTGKAITLLSATTAAGFNLPHGVAPTTPINGDLWTTTLGLYARINGATVGPYVPVVISGMTAGQIPISASATTITSSANLSGDVTSNAALATTLATVNVNVGTFQGLTVNAKGLVTAAVDQGYAVLANDLAALEALTTNGVAVRTGTSAWTTRTITGTAGRIAITNGDGIAGNPTINLDTAYIGQNTITTLGTITTGTWNGSTIGLAYGGTAANLSATGGAGRVVKQTTVGGALTVAAVTAAEIDGAPQVPALLGSAGLASATDRSIAVIGNFAYTTCGVATPTHSIEIWDITIPTAPVKLGGLDLAFAPLGSLAVAGQILYTGVNNSTNGLQIVDVSNPKLPVLIRNHPVVAISSVVISGGYLYCGVSAAGNLRIFDISNPALPIQKVALTLTGTAGPITGIALQGKYAYVVSAQTVAGTAGLNIVDISDPVTPVIISTYNLVSNGRGVAVAGKYLYVSESVATNGLEIIDVSDPATPVLVKVFATSLLGAQYVNPIVAGNYLYYAGTGGGNSFQVINITDPVNPVSVGSFAGTTPGGMALSGDRLYANASGQIRVYDTFGADVTTLRAGALSTDTLNVDGASYFAGDIYAQRSLVVGQAGIFSRGPIISDASEAAIPISAILGIGLVCIGGNSNAFPALKRSAAILQARLGDDSGYADMDIGGLTLTRGVGAVTIQVNSSGNVSSFRAEQSQATVYAGGTASNTGARIEVYNSDNATAGSVTRIIMGMYDSAAARSSSAIINAVHMVHTAAAETSHLTFQLTNAGTFTERGRIAGFNWGIGANFTANQPQATLHVGATAATARTHNLFADTSNGEWAYIGDWASNVARYGTAMNGTGVARDVSFLYGGTEQFRQGSTGVTFTAAIIQKPGASVTPVNNGELVAQATSNTSLTFKYKGSDGVVRSASLTLA